VVDAGKVIMVISLLLWFLCSYGPGNNIDIAEKRFEQELKKSPAKKDSLEKNCLPKNCNTPMQDIWDSL